MDPSAGTVAKSKRRDEKMDAEFERELAGLRKLWPTLEGSAPPQPETVARYLYSGPLNLGGICGARGDYKDARAWFAVAARSAAIEIADRRPRFKTRPRRPPLGQPPNFDVQTGAAAMAGRVGEFFTARILAGPPGLTRGEAAEWGLWLAWQKESLQEGLSLLYSGRAHPNAYPTSNGCGWAMCFRWLLPALELGDLAAIGEAKESMERFVAWHRNGLGDPFLAGATRFEGVPLVQASLAFIASDGPGLAEHLATLGARLGRYSDLGHLRGYNRHLVVPRLLAHARMGPTGPCEAVGLPAGFDPVRYWSE